MLPNNRTLNDFRIDSSTHADAAGIPAETSLVLQMEVESGLLCVSDMARWFRCAGTGEVRTDWPINHIIGNSNGITAHLKLQ